MNRKAGGAEPVFSNLDELRGAYNQMEPNSAEASINWLRDAMTANKDNAEAYSAIQILLYKLKESYRLTNEVYDYLDKLFLTLNTGE